MFNVVPDLILTLLERIVLCRHPTLTNSGNNYFKCSRKEEMSSFMVVEKSELWLLKRVSWYSGKI